MSTEPRVRRAPAPIATPLFLTASLALLAAGCQGGAGTPNASAEEALDQRLKAPEFGQLDIGMEGVELGIGLATKSDDGTVRTRFTARSTNAGAPLVYGLSLTFWIDADGDNALGETERATVLERREPGGVPRLSIPIEVPYEDGRKLRFIATVETSAGTKTIPGDFALP